MTVSFPSLQLPLCLINKCHLKTRVFNTRLPFPPITCRLGYFSLMYFIILIWKMEFPWEESCNRKKISFNQNFFRLQMQLQKSFRFFTLLAGVSVKLSNWQNDSPNWAQNSKRSCCQDRNVLPRTKEVYCKDFSMVKTSVISFRFNPVASTEGNKQNIWLWIRTIWLYQQDTVSHASNYRWNGECSLWNPAGLVGDAPPCCAAQIPDVEHWAFSPCQSLWPSQMMFVKHFLLHSHALRAQQTDSITINEKTMCKYRQWQPVPESLQARKGDQQSSSALTDHSWTSVRESLTNAKGMKGN